MVQERVKVDPEVYKEVYKIKGLKNKPEFTTWVVNNIGETNISNSDDPESEVHAAINPTDQNNIIASAIKWSTGSFIPSLKVPIYYSKDQGATWEESSFEIDAELPFTTFVAGGGDPILVFDNRGTAYFSWLTLTIDILSGQTLMQLHWAISEDGGATWNEAETLIDEGEIEGSLIDQSNLSGRLVDKQWMAADLKNNNLYTAYVEIEPIDSVTVNYNILVKTKPGDGDAFGDAIEVTSEDIVFAQFSSVDVDSKGNVHVLFAGANSH